MKKKFSEISFTQMTKGLAFVKIKWNGKVIFDDNSENFNLANLDNVYVMYGNRYVYSMKVKIVQGHHCELKIRGEKEFIDRKMVLTDTKYGYEYSLVNASDIERIAAKPLSESKERELLKEYEDICGDTYGPRTRYDIRTVKVNNLDNYPWITYGSTFYTIEPIKNRLRKIRICV